MVLGREGGTTSANARGNAWSCASSPLATTVISAFGLSKKESLPFLAADYRMELRGVPPIAFWLDTMYTGAIYR
jgi:hypothetical protein